MKPVTRADAAQQLAGSLRLSAKAMQQAADALEVLLAPAEAVAPEPTGEMYFSPEQVAERLSLHVDHIRNLLRAGEIQGSKIGSRWRVSETAVSEYIAANRFERMSDEDVAAVREYLREAI